MDSSSYMYTKLVAPKNLNLLNTWCPEYDYLFKILIIGDSGTGKSSLLLRFCDNYFSENFISTIGVDFKIKTINIDGRFVKLQIWDSAGQERFRTLTTTYYRGANGIIIVYDVTDRTSFVNISSWLSEIERHASDHVTKIIIGNKVDKLERDVDYDAANTLSEKLKVPLIEASAKDDVNVEKAFFELAKLLKNKHGSPIENNSNKREVCYIAEGSSLLEPKQACCQWS